MKDWCQDQPDHPTRKIGHQAAPEAAQVTTCPCHTLGHGEGTPGPAGARANSATRLPSLLSCPSKPGMKPRPSEADTGPCTGPGPRIQEPSLYAETYTPVEIRLPSTSPYHSQAFPPPCQHCEDSQPHKGEVGLRKPGDLPSPARGGSSSSSFPSNWGRPAALPRLPRTSWTCPLLRPTHTGFTGMERRSLP